MAGTTVDTRILSNPSSAERQAIIQHNKLVTDVAELARAFAYLMPGALITAPAGKGGTTDAKTWRTEAFSFTFRGKVTASAAQEKALTATTHDVAASKQAWYFLTVQTDGTSYTVTKGADQVIGTNVYPTAPDNEVIVSTMKIVTGVTGYVANTDNLAVAGTIITALTFVDPPATGAAAMLAAKISASGVEVTT